MPYNRTNQIASYVLLPCIIVSNHEGCSNQGTLLNVEYFTCYVHRVQTQL